MSTNQSHRTNDSINPMNLNALTAKGGRNPLEAHRRGETSVQYSPLASRLSRAIIEQELTRSPLRHQTLYFYLPTSGQEVLEEDRLCTYAEVQELTARMGRKECEKHKDVTPRRYGKSSFVVQASRVSSSAIQQVSCSHSSHSSHSPPLPGTLVNPQSSS